MAIDLDPKSDDATWMTGQLVGDHNTRSTQEIPWDGSAADSRGFARQDTITLEDGNQHDALRTHPKWVNRGTIKGFYPWVTAPDNAIFTADVGFVDGATASNGVTFWVWEHHMENGREVWNPIARHRKEYTGDLDTIRADLSHLSGERVSIELRVDAEGSSAQDWAAWVDPTLEDQNQTSQPEKSGSMPITIDLETFHCRNADEDQGFLFFSPDKDEPYLLSAAIVVDGASVPVEEAILNGNTSAAGARVVTGGDYGRQGNLHRGDVGGGQSFTIPEETGEFELEIEGIVPPIAAQFSDEADPKSVATAGIVTIAMEQDNTSASAIQSGYQKLRDGLQRELDDVVQNAVSQVDLASGSGPQFELSPQVAQDITDSIEGEIRNAIKDETLERWDLFGAINSDDYVGSDFASWTMQDIQSNEPIPFSMTFDSRSGTKYEIDGEVRNE